MTVVPEPPLALAEALDAAEELRYAVHEWVSHLRMHNVARLTRAVFPTAAAVVIDIENQHVEPEGVQLAGILDATGTVDACPGQHGAGTAEGSRFGLTRGSHKSIGLGFEPRVRSWNRTPVAHSWPQN